MPDWIKRHSSWIRVWLVGFFTLLLNVVSRALYDAHWNWVIRGTIGGLIVLVEVATLYLFSDSQDENRDSQDEAEL